jgi:CDP-glycerol glycerophosphotransferase
VRRYELDGEHRARIELDGLEDGEWVLPGVALGEGATWPWRDREAVLWRTYMGDAAVVVREPRPVLTGARWTEGGELELAGHGALHELVLVDDDRGDRHAFAVEHGPDGRFTARLTPAVVTTLAGTLPLAEGTWRIQGDSAPAMIASPLFEQLPVATVVDHKPFALGVGRDDRAVLMVHRDLDVDERGGHHQRRLRETAYAARRSEPLRDLVVYASFGGRQYSDSPRAIHEELVRRAAPLEHLWVVRDGRCRVPDSATPIREDSREYHEALAHARYVISNDHFPEWFARRADQVCVQTWHGTPLKRIGLDVSGARKAIRRFQRRWDQQKANWQYVVSPNRFSTPILQRAYAIEGELLETGYPRVDVLAGADREARTRALRERLGLPEDRLVVLYAPTYRDQLRDRKGRYRLDLQLDLDRLRSALGGRAVILFRKHHYVADAAPSTPDGFVRDVSSYPDGTELMLAADVLVTDYSSMMVDFANTGRPMLFHTYDLDAYREEIRGFYLDFVATVPGPLLSTTDELAEALLDIDGTHAAYAERYAAFRETFCELDDGGAAARVVDRTISC